MTSTRNHEAARRRLPLSLATLGAELATSRRGAGDGSRSGISRRRRRPRGGIVNHGVFLVAGEASGVYARVQAGATDDRAISTPALVER